MLLSMTGYGEDHRQVNGRVIAVELRTVNSRYFKMNIRSPEGYGRFEPQIEAVLRKYIKRGTIQVNVRVEQEASPDDYQVNALVLSSYRKQLQEIYDQFHISDAPNPEALLLLPGVINEIGNSKIVGDQQWPLVEESLIKALEQLAQMRADEGQAMAANLQVNSEAIAAELEKISVRTPLVAEAYRNRLTERLNKLLAEFEVEIEPADIVRELGIFTERSDISEEIVRMKSHLEQFKSIMNLKESSGRKLEFLTQEMFRETNTIGSKANDSEIARHVIEIKAAIERMREMIQNVE